MKKNKILFIIISVVAAVIFITGLSFFIFHKEYQITTAKYSTSWGKEDSDNVVMAMGKENTEERFRLYFQYYNVIHELGHGLITYNNGTALPIVEEEQLVNDFAVAYWKYYGEQEKIDELYDIVTYAVENVGDNYKNGVDYMELGKENSSLSAFNNDFFNFVDYGWFQFSSVKRAIEEDKSLEEVLTEMGMKNFKIVKDKTLVHKNIDEKESTIIINEVVDNFHKWGLDFPKVTQKFSKDPNANMSGPKLTLPGIIASYKRNMKVEMLGIKEEE